MDVHLDPIIHGPNRETRDRKTVPILRPKARPHVELPAMRPTGHDGPFQAALAQGILCVGAPVLHGVDDALDPEKAHIDPLDLNAQTPAIGNLVFFCDSSVAQSTAFVCSSALSGLPNPLPVLGNRIRMTQQNPAPLSKSVEPVASERKHLLIDSPPKAIVASL
jgi:hypothetical protein